MACVHRKRRRPAERAALLDSGVQEFVLNGNVPAAENVTRVMHNLEAIVTACRSPGPLRLPGPPGPHRASEPRALMSECSPAVEASGEGDLVGMTDE